MADIFISYSRKDKGFVQRLDDALRQRQREAWVDWEGIRPTEEFMQAIYAAIEGAHTFVFVLTPDSVSSEVCGKEIAHAVAQNKRMVPLVARDVNAADVPEALAKLNWIYCRDTDPFDAATDTLISALDTDLDWVRTHTRLLTRALEWESKGKNNSFVLRGDDLRTAEQWLAQAGTDKERQPTVLQTEYIIASRKAETRRQRTIRTWVTVAAAVSIVLAILAWTQRGKAVAQEKVAIKNADEANQQKQAALQNLSQSEFAQGIRLAGSGEPGEALAYFARAVRLTGHSAAATRLVSLLIDRVWVLPQAEQRQSDGEVAYYSPDGLRVVALRRDGTIELRDGATSKPIGALLGNYTKLNWPIVEFSPDGSRLVMWTAEKGDSPEKPKYATRLWDTATGRLVTELAARGVFSPDGHRLAVSGRDGIQFLDTQNGTKLSMIPAEMPRLVSSTEEFMTGAAVERASSRAFSRDGERFIAVSGAKEDRSAQVWDVATGNPVGLPLKISSASGEPAALSPDGQFVVFAGRDPQRSLGTHQTWDFRTGTPLSPLMKDRDSADATEFNAGNQWTLGVNLNGAWLEDATTGRVLGKTFRHRAGQFLASAFFSPDGARVLTTTQDGTVRVWDAMRTDLLAEEFCSADIADAMFSSDGRSVVTTGVGRQTWNVLGAPAMPLVLAGRASGYHGFSLLTLDQNDKKLRVWDVRTGKILVEAAYDEPDDLRRGVFSADGRRLLLACKQVGRVFDIPSGKELPPLASKGMGVELSSDGSRALTVAGTPAIWDVESGKRLRVLKPGTGGRVDAACLSPDGHLAATATDNSIQIWDVEAGRIQSPPMRCTEVQDVCFSPDGLKLVSFDSGAMIVQLWDSLSGKVIGQPITTPWSQGGTVAFNMSSSCLSVLTYETAEKAVLRLFATDSGKEIGASYKYIGAQATFSPDDRFIALANGSVLDATTGKALVDPIHEQQRENFSRVTFAPDSKRMVLAGASGQSLLDARGIAVVCDPSTGAELLDVKRDLTGGGQDAHFSPDGCLLIVDSNPARVWDLAPPDKPPAWLADLAEIAGGYRLGDRGALELVPNRIDRIARLKRELATLPAEDRWTQVARWFLAEPAKRTISPYSPIKVADFVRQRIEANTLEALREAVRASPEDLIVRTRLGVQCLQPNQLPGDRLSIQADHETLFATLLGPGNAEVWRARAKVLQALQRLAEADEAAKKAAALASSVK